MATELNKKITRESTLESDGRRINVNLNPDQTISFKLKGLKTGEVKIDILELYQQLVGVSGNQKNTSSTKGPVVIENEKQAKVNKNNPLIPLNTLRSMSAISTLDDVTIMKFDSIIVEVINKLKTEK